MGGYLQAYTLYSSVRPFGITAIVGGWDSELELPVDGQVIVRYDLYDVGQITNIAVPNGC